MKYYNVLDIFFKNYIFAKNLFKISKTLRYSSSPSPHIHVYMYACVWIDKHTYTYTCTQIHIYIYFFFPPQAKEMQGVSLGG